MKQEFKAEWYDERYKVGGHKKEYFKEPEKCIYYPLWKEVIRLLKKKDRILEIGCGAGQLAKMLIYSQFNYLRGFDFSEEAIFLSLSNLPFNHRDKIQVGDVYDKEMYDVDYDTVICCEVFEHLNGDREVLMNIKKDTKIIFTVPNFDSKSHMRYFNDASEIRDRFKDLVKFISISEIPVSEKNKIYLINCIKK